jgi:hypothetical protein
MKKVGFWVSVVLLLFLGLSGIQSFFGDWGDVETLGQRACNVGQAAFGVSGLLAGLGAIFRKSWAGPVALGFAVSAGLTAGIAPVVWGGSEIAVGFGSGAVGLLLGLLFFLGVREPGATPAAEVPLRQG